MEEMKNEILLATANKAKIRYYGTRLREQGIAAARSCVKSTTKRKRETARDG